MDHISWDLQVLYILVKISITDSHLSLSHDELFLIINIHVNIV